MAVRENFPLEVISCTELLKANTGQSGKERKGEGVWGNKVIWFRKREGKFFGFGETA